MDKRFRRHGLRILIWFVIGVLPLIFGCTTPPASPSPTPNQQPLGPIQITPGPAISVDNTLRGTEYTWRGSLIASVVIEEWVDLQ